VPNDAKAAGARPQAPVLLGASPHKLVPVKTPQIMLAVIVALLPLAVNAVRLFGARALVLLIVCPASAVLWELLFQLATKQKTRIADLSSAVSGLLLALIVPPGLPLWMAVVGTFFAVVVAKEFFGGIGANPFNPALIGRAVLLMSFPRAMTSWAAPFAAVDAASHATPLGVAKEFAASAIAAESQGALRGPFSAIARSLGSNGMKDVYWTLFIGNRSGSLGETSILFVLVGAAILLGLRVIGPLIPLAVLGSTALLSWVLGIDPLFALLSGGVAFGAVFMATDYSSSPMTPWGKAIYGVSIGAIIVLIRKFGAFPEGVTYAILILNALVPFLNRIRARKYGYIPPARGGKAGKEAKA
jgi:Na+-translocating ferredoxin:NAD+ oxidoreductase subunit D